MVMALGGSTNAVLHLIAMAKSIDLELTLEDFQKVTYFGEYLGGIGVKCVYKKKKKRIRY